MKKLLIAIVLALLTTGSFAQHHHRWDRPVYVYRDNWVAPLIIGGIAGAIIMRESQQPQPVIVQQQPVIVPQPQTVCSEWREILTADGRIYRERSCYQTP